MRTPTAGIVLHEALSRISGIADVEIAVGRMVTEGFITNDPVDALKKDLNDILGIELMKEWFSGEWEVKSESEILLDDGTVIRPDKVMIKGSEAVVLDYKTGIRQKEHKKQLDTYADALLKMGYEKVSRFILYTSEKELVEI